MKKQIKELLARKEKTMKGIELVAERLNCYRIELAAINAKINELLD